MWDAYLDQPLAGAETLRQFIDGRLSQHVYPPDVVRLRADLAAIQEAVEDLADFTPQQRATIIAALQLAGLEGARIRFRSSTNVEDSESFSGAGLYDSYSGCLEDDTDSDNAGPSHCDPAEAKERGVFRALRKVYASFYNENAFLERLRHGIIEAEVGMAILVHFSCPWKWPVALATWIRRRRAGFRSARVDSPANGPTGCQHADPEGHHWSDFEYKRIVPGQVGLKQIRAVPHPTPVPPPTIP